MPDSQQFKKVQTCQWLGQPYRYGSESLARLMTIAAVRTSYLRYHTAKRPAFSAPEIAAKHDILQQREVHQRLHGAGQLDLTASCRWTLHIF